MLYQIIGGHRVSFRYAEGKVIEGNVQDSKIYRRELVSRVMENTKKMSKGT